MRFVLLCAVAALSVGACSSDDATPDTGGATSDAGALTEGEGVEQARRFAATDLRVGLEAAPGTDVVVVTGLIVNAGPSDAGDVRVLVEFDGALGAPAELPAGCELVGDAISCLVAGSLVVQGSAPDSPEDEQAEFELALAVDEGALPEDRTITISATVTASNLDLENDTDPDNNVAVVSATAA